LNNFEAPEFDSGPFASGSPSPNDEHSCSVLQGVSKKKNILSSFATFLELAGILIIYSAFAKYLRKNGSTMKKFISSL